MRLTLVAGLALGLAACVTAEEGGGFSFEPQLSNSEAGGKFVAKGHAHELPAGAMLHVELLVRGQSRHPIRAAFMKVPVEDDHSFKGEWTWQGKKLAPLTYEANVSLRMNKQPPPVRRELAKNYGWHGDHNESLTSVEVSLGSAEEAEAFKAETLKRLTDSINDLEGFIAEGVSLCSQPADSEGWVGKFGELAGRIRVRYRMMRDFHQAVVVRQQEGLFKRLINIYSGMTDALRNHQAGLSQGLETLEKLPEATRILREEINSRKPIEPTLPLDTPEDEDEGEPEVGEGAGK